jgi:hypothetical protein
VDRKPVPPSWRCYRRGFDWQPGGMPRVYTEADCPFNWCTNNNRATLKSSFAKKDRRMLRGLHCHVSLCKSPSPGSSGRRSRISAKQHCTANLSIRLRRGARRGAQRGRLDLAQRTKLYTFPVGSAMCQEGSPKAEQGIAPNCNAASQSSWVSMLAPHQSSAL